jgi:hypothetical protein
MAVEANLHLTTERGEIVAFTADNAALERPDLCFGLEIESYFTPSAAEILAAEAALTTYLPGVAPPPASWDTRASLWTRIDEYRRQYFGVVQAGRRRLFASFFYRDYHRPDLGGPDFYRGLVCIDDGGYDVFQVCYDLDRGEFVSFTANGEA